jgi:hypothetical protein
MSTHPHPGPLRILSADWDDAGHLRLTLDYSGHIDSHTTRLIEAAPALQAFVEQFIQECERQGISSHDMPLLRQARYVAAQAGERRSPQPASRAHYARASLRGTA